MVCICGEVFCLLGLQFCYVFLCHAMFLITHSNEAENPNGHQQHSAERFGVMSMTHCSCCCVDEQGAPSATLPHFSTYTDSEGLDPQRL